MLSKEKTFRSGLLLISLVFLNLLAAPGYSASPDANHPGKGKAVYDRYCAGCHGDKGDGQGIYKTGLYPQPRDFTRGIFKWTGGSAGSLPSDIDLLTTISEGVHGTAMPSWQALRGSEQEYVIQYVKSFSGRFKEEHPPGERFIYPPPSPPTPGLIAQGKLVYEKMGCAVCHGSKGRGNGPSSHTLMDDWENPILPANFSKGVFKTGREVWKIYRTVSNGVGGTPMPAFSDQLSHEEIWEVVYYIRSLKE